MQNFIISNGIIFRYDFKFHKGDLYISNGKITGTIPNDAKIINAEDLYIIPGLVDIHFHGCMGRDFCDGTQESFKIISDYQRCSGITSMCPATMTLPEKFLINIMAEAKKFHENFPNLAGIFLEGPFISQSKKGAQNSKYIIKPNADILKNLNDASGGLIKIAALAPEVEGAFDFIEASKKITKISLAHTACDYETAKKAFKAGISHVTHMYNAMNPVNHRAPGPVTAALENENVSVELICDGVHVHPAIVRNTIKIFGDDRVIFVSDSMEATGMPDGIYELGGQKVVKKGNKALLDDSVTIAGSVTNLAGCMRTAVKEMNVPLESAVKCCTINPAKAIGIEKFCASLQPDKYADIIALDKDLNLIFVMDRYGFLLNKN